MKIPVCQDCIHYRNRLCNKFQQDYSGVILREYTVVCRRDEDKCGEYGKHFKRDRFANVKKKIYNMKKRFPYFIIGIYVLFLRITRH